MTGWRLRQAGLGTAVLAAALASLAVPATAATKVPVRAAVHGDYVRIVFDWPAAAVTYSATVDGGRLLVRFGEPVEPVLQPLLERLSAWVSSAAVEADGRTVAFVLQHPGKVVRDGHSGKSVYVDLGEDLSAPASPALSPPPQPTPSPAPPTPAAASGTPPVVAAAPSPAAPPSASPAAAAAAGDATSPAVAADAGGQPASASGSASASAAASAPADSDGSGSAPSPVLVFDPGEPASAAVYVRSDQMYVVFDRPLTLGAGTLTGNSGNLIGTIQPVLATGGSAFRMTMRPWLRPSVTRDGVLWRVVFVPKVQAARTELPVEVQPEFPLGGRLLIHAPDAPSVVEVTDPEVGDRLLVVPLPVAVQAVSDVNRFPELDFLSALQGIVIRPHGDGVYARPVREGIEITGSGGLHLSPTADAALARPSGANGPDAVLDALGGQGAAANAADAGSSAPGADRRLFDVAGWQRGGVRDFTKNRQELMQNVADATPKERNRARMELARFYFAHGFNQEAIGVLAVLAADQPDVQGWPEFRALRGAARVGGGEPKEGLEDLSGPGLDDSREALLWRAAARAMLRQDWPVAAHDFLMADDLLAGYPDPYFRRMSLLAADARVQTNDPHEAERLLKRLIRRSGAESDEQPAIQFFRGEVAREMGKVPEAIKQLQAAEDGNDRYYRARAGLARLNLEYQEKRISAATAADRLSRLRFAWRGDELELDIIERHGNMEWEAGDYAEGLNTLREAAGYFSDSPRASVITQHMGELFAGLFQDGAAKLPPLKAIELYDQFRELTPVGVAGDQVIRQLAERLVEVDLLNRAADLLQHQVDYRLAGLEKTRVGTRLASIQLLDSKSDLALKAIDGSDGPNLPPELVEERKLLKARALAQLKRSGEALKLLTGDTSRPADMLRVDIAWHDQRWDDAAIALEKVIGAAPPAAQPLDKATSQLVLNRAIALSLTGDSGRLGALRASFGPAMAKTEDAAAFQVLTRPEQAGGLIDLATIKSRVAEVDVFQNFLKDYHKRNPAPAS